MEPTFFFYLGLDAFLFVILSAATFQFLFNTSAIISDNVETTGLNGFLAEMKAFRLYMNLVYALYLREDEDLTRNRGWFHSTRHSSNVLPYLSDHFASHSM